MRRPAWRWPVWPAWLVWSGRAWPYVRWMLVNGWRRRPLLAVVLGMLLLWTCLAGAQAWLRQWDALSHLNTQHAPDRSHTMTASRAPASRQELDARQRLQAFMQVLPERAALPQLQQDLMQLGQAQGLQMARGEYRWQVDASGHLGRYHMRLPVRGQALAIQRFMQQALLAHPALALEGLRMARAAGAGEDGPLAAADGGIVARLDWVVLVRLPAGATP